MFGMIMPEPLAMPAMVTSVPPIDAVRADPVGKVSVVMMASAAAGQSPGASAAAAPGRQPVMQSAGSGSPITPVEARKTSCAAQPKRWAAAAAVRSTASTPAAPVKALALPELTTMARAVPRPRCWRHQSTGADGMDERVKTPARVVPAASSATNRSFRPL